MTKKPHASIFAFVSAAERAAIKSAASYIARALSQAAGVPWSCEFSCSPDMEGLQRAGDSAIIVTSLLPDLGELDESWAKIEQRLKTAYAGLCAGRAPVFICTILRHIGCEVEPNEAAALRIRIRRLNLLAAEISREMKVYVVDLDRALADVGAQRLQTDYRMTGETAADLAGHFIALTLIENVFDGIVSFEIQEIARSIHASRRPLIAAPDIEKGELAIRRYLLPIGQGRRKQIIRSAFPDNYSRLFLRQVLRGTIKPTEALHKLARTVRRLGFRETAMLFVSGFSRRSNRD